MLLVCVRVGLTLVSTADTCCLLRCHVFASWLTLVMFEHLACSQTDPGRLCALGGGRCCGEADRGVVVGGAWGCLIVFFYHYHNHNCIYMVYMYRIYSLLYQDVNDVTLVEIKYCYA